MFKNIAVISSSASPSLAFLPEGGEVQVFTAKNLKDFNRAIKEVAGLEGVSLAVLVTDENERQEQKRLTKALDTLGYPIWDHRIRSEGAISRIAVTVNPFRPPGEVERQELRVLRVADALAKWLSAELYVVHAWKAQAEGRVRTRMKEINFESTITEAEPSIMRAVKRTIQNAGLDIPEENICLSHGNPAAILPVCVKSLQADLVVTGYSARRFLTRAVVRDTGLGLLPDFERDLVFVRPRRLT